MNITCFFYSSFFGMSLACFGGHSVALTRVKSASPNNLFISKAPCPSDVSQILLADRWLSKHIGRNSRYGAWAAPEWFVSSAHMWTSSAPYICFASSINLSTWFRKAFLCPSRRFFATPVEGNSISLYLCLLYRH